MRSACTLRMLTHTVGDVTYLRFHGTKVVLDEENAQQLRERLSSLVKAGRCKIVVDLCAVHYLTSTGVETFLAIHRHLKGKGGRLSLQNLTLPVVEIFAILKLDHVLDVEAPPDPGSVPSMYS
jgi:anti-anti-sigma factor